MLECYHENSIAQQTSYWTAIGTSAGKSPRGEAYEHECPQAFFYDRRLLGTLPAAAVPATQNSVPPSARALPLGSSSASFGDAAREGRAGRQHSIFPDR